ncbi:mannan endo-1,4-beta-mannosidase [Aplysia californica]|uniref:Mannan endo-1,4-beta-mannosidase n=1 Tax=Aplysia californica TaxID=6500 RepID=A0ABM0ZX42_APLCA|nr:mannan endo-1,4-beta-mannosidase [Aplysia californica]
MATLTVHSSYTLVSMKSIILLLLAALIPLADSRLSVSGTKFKFNNETVFLSGANLAWINYGYDFGFGYWTNTKPKIEEQFKLLKQAGGSTMRVWIHFEAVSSPLFDNRGFVTAGDDKGKFMGDFKDLFDTALKYNILVIATLWNADSKARLLGLIRNTAKLQSYIDNVLKPMATLVKGHRALGGYDIINEPEGIIYRNTVNSNKCFDTTNLNFGIGWHTQQVTYEQMLRFINWQSAAIKSADPGALVTVGIWEGRVMTDKYNMVNHYKDSCLKAAGGKEKGVLDFYSVHSYSNFPNNQFDVTSVFKHSAPDYGLDKPIVVGEFAVKYGGGGMTTNELFSYAYTHGYAGAWSWQLSENGPEQLAAITHIKDFTGNGNITIHL